MAKDRTNELLTFKFCDDDSGIKVDTRGRGGWKRRGTGPVASFIGFDGEDIITIIQGGMQSGENDLVIVYSPIDSPNYVYHQTVKFGEETDFVNDTIRKIEQEHLNGRNL